MSFITVRKWFWNPYSRLGARWHGWRDARLAPPLPRWDSAEPSPYLRQLHEAADLEIGDLIHGFVQRDTPLDDRLQQLVANERSVQQEMERAEQVKADAVERFSTLNPGVPASTAEHRMMTYWAIILFLLICEVPLNGTVFQVLKEGQLFNYLISAGIGVLILLAAHSAGVHLRRKPFGDRPSSVMFVVVMTVPLMTVFVIASLRQYYLHLRGLVNSEGERIAYFAFLSINLLMFTVAFYMSWFSHLEGAEELTRARRIVERLRRELKRIEKTLRVVRAARLNLHRQSVTRARQALDGFWQLVHVYADSNLRKRNDRKSRDNDLLVTDAARLSLRINIPRALQSEYLDYRDSGSAEVRSVGSAGIGADSGTDLAAKDELAVTVGTAHPSDSTPTV